MIVINHCANDDSIKKNGKELFSSIYEVKLKLSSLLVTKKYVESMCEHSLKFIYLKNLTFHLSDRILKTHFIDVLEFFFNRLFFNFDIINLKIIRLIT